MRGRMIIAAIAVLLMPLTFAFSQETERVGPPPIVWAVPHLQLQNEAGSAILFRGLDASLALPLSPHTNVTATWFLDLHDKDQLSATFNYDKYLSQNTVLRGSIGLIHDDAGLGVTLHRSFDTYGIGAFAQRVDGGGFEGGLMLTRTVPWGVKLTRAPRPARSESMNWNSGAGDVGALGARAAFSWRSGDNGEVATTTAFFPVQRQSWPREGQSAQSGSATGTDFPPPLKPAWKYQTEGPIRTSAAIVDGVAYVGSYDGWLYAIDVARGQRLWRFPAESPITGAPAVVDNRVYFGTESGDVFCVARPPKGGAPAGRLVWKYRASASVTSSPLVTDKGLVIFGACDSYIYGLDAVGGRQVWKVATGGPVIASASKIARRIPGAVDDSGKPTARTATVLIGSSDGKLYAIEEVAGRPIWTFTSDAPITATPVIFGDRIYLANRAGSLYALEAATGLHLWSAKVTGSIGYSPAVDEQSVYVGTLEGKVVALEAATGKAAWECTLGTALAAPPTLVRGQLMYLVARDGRLWALDRETGKVVYVRSEGEPLSTAAAIADGRLLLGTEKGMLLAFQPAPVGTPLPTPDDDLPQPAQPAAVSPAPPAQTPEPAAKPVASTLTPPANPPAKPSGGASSATAAAAADFPRVVTPPAAAQTPTPVKPSQSVTPLAQTPPHYPLLTLLLTPSDGSTPLFLSNLGSLQIGGKVAASAGIVSLKVNGKDTPIRNGEYSATVEFPGPGEYLLLVEAYDKDGHGTNYRRIVRVLEGTAAQGTQPLKLSLRGGLPIVLITPGLGPSQTEALTKTLEIRTPDGKVLKSWKAPAADALEVAWNGADANGKTLPTGAYEVRYILSNEKGPVASICQPLVLQQ